MTFGKKVPVVEDKLTAYEQKISKLQKEMEHREQATKIRVSPLATQPKL